ncbi:MAG TPA: hypothetical protein VD994_01265, partial [Prosthecobacter sp.]|nr:hypothetical protein [Prosthecobacter sp.]
MLTLEEFVQLTQQAGNEDEEIRIDGDQPPEVAFRQLKAALNDKYGEAVGKGAFTDAGLEGKQERGEPLKVRDVNKALTRAEIRAAWPTVHFYIPFTAQELHKTRENKDEKWNGKVDYRSGKGLPDLLDSVLEYKEVIENEEKRKNVNVILVDDGSQALKNLTPRDTLYIMGHGVITD